eukprot:GHVH01008753.1.p1 GENE.GHVH01008753.1~~GHVH01008753.1.p1  ORF type:complete len:591 (-),score=54.98 GHVH01008753.1:336-2108(-)
MENIGDGDKTRRRVISNVRVGNTAKLPSTVGHLWRITTFLGQGSFGSIYKGEKLESAPSNVGNRSVPDEVAIKFESIRTPYPQLSSEKQIISMIHTKHESNENSMNGKNDSSISSNGVDVNSGNLLGFPHYYYYGIEGDFYCLAMTLLGPSLHNLFENRKVSRWTFNTVAPVGIQMLDRIEVLHKKGHIHRDIKPDNFLLGVGDKSHIVHMIDFGLAKTYRTSSGAHQPAVQGKQLTGTARYASITAHAGVEQSRRDDLEALIYCLVFFLAGKLPWQGLKPCPGQRQKYDHIMNKKYSMTTICTSRPTRSLEIWKCLREVRSYAYNQRPRYAWIRNQLTVGLMRRLPIFKCLQMLPTGSISVNLSRADAPSSYDDRVPYPDWTKSREWLLAEIDVEEKFLCENSLFLVPKKDERPFNAFFFGYPDELIQQFIAPPSTSEASLPVTRKPADTRIYLSKNTISRPSIVNTLNSTFPKAIDVGANLEVSQHSGGVSIDSFKVHSNSFNYNMIHSPKSDNLHTGLIPQRRLRPDSNLFTTPQGDSSVIVVNPRGIQQSTPGPHSVSPQRHLSSKPPIVEHHHHSARGTPTQRRW